MRDTILHPRTVSATAQAIGTRLAAEDRTRERAEADPAVLFYLVLTSLREMTAMYDGMDAHSFWSQQVRAKVERARAALARVDGQ